MLAVVEIQYIRQEANLKGRSYAEIARRMNIDPRTVKKYAEMEDFTPVKKKQKRKAPVMDPVKPILDKWIKEDLGKKKKYRRTAKRMYTMLKEQHNFKGSYRSVRRYVQERKEELLEELETAVLPLETRPATAQVDLGMAPFIYQGEYVELPFIVVSFPDSNAAYTQVLLFENTEWILEALKRIFHHMGQVPRVIRFDNLSAAVKRILPNGDRELTDIFQRFVLHYGFECEFCNVGRGNEKGNVESKINYIRNNFFLPEQRIDDLEQFNQQLLEKCEKDWERPHYRKERSIANLFEEEKNFFLQLPEKEFECVRYEEVKADKYGFIRFETNQYSTSPQFAKKKLIAKISYNEIEILTEDYISIIKHKRMYEKTQRSLKWQPYLTLMAKRPNALKYTSFYDQMPEEWRNYLSNCTTEEKKKALELLASLLKEHDFELATQALRLAGQVVEHPDIESIKQIFYQLINGRGIREKIDLKSDIPVMPEASRGVQHYNQLYKQSGGELNGSPDQRICQTIKVELDSEELPSDSS